MNALRRALRSLKNAYSFVLDVHYYHATGKYSLRKSIQLARNTL